MSENAKLLERRNKAVPQGLVSSTALYAVKAENAELWDADGNRFIDFACGIAVCNTGHRHPRVIDSVQKQLDAFSHTAFQVAAYESYIALAERLNKAAPIAADCKTAFFTTGAEAVENAIKIARVKTGRPGVISFRGAFHGRTALTSSLTGKIAPYRAAMGLTTPGVFHAPFPVPHHGITVEDAIAALDSLFKVDIEPGDVAAIILEPVQGEGGFYVTPQPFMEHLRALCDKHGIVFIADEVQAGFARTGKLFAMEHYPVEPDLITVAKALAGGFPLSGVIGRSEIMDACAPGGLGGTYGGSPIGCAAAHAVLDVIKDEKLCERSLEIGERIIARLKEIKSRSNNSPIGDIRGLGAMCAFEIVARDGSGRPDPDAVKPILSKALSKGLILLTCGYWANTIRLLPPLTISDHHLEEALDIISESIEELE